MDKRDDSRGSLAASTKYLKTLKYLAVHDDDSNSGTTTDILDLRWNGAGTKLAHSRTSKSVYATGFTNNAIVSHATLKDCHAGPAAAGGGGAVESLSWDPNSENVLATVGNDSVVKIWSTETAKTIAEVTIPGKGKLVAYSAKGVYLAVVSREHDADLNASVHVLSVVSLKQNCKVVLQQRFDKYIYSFCWGNDDRMLVVGFEDGIVALYEVQETTAGKERDDIANNKNMTQNGSTPAEGPAFTLSKLYDIHASVSCINTVVYDPRGRFIAVGSHEGIISLWSLRSLSCVRTIAEIDEPVMSLDFSWDGEYLAATFKDGSNSRLYSPETGAEYLEVKGSKGSEYNIAKLAFRPKQTSFAYSTANGEVMVAQKPYDR